ncbi:leucine-rich repeat domain-containing protein [Kitasatospora fiedleri]|uniref:ribonuclease inhibitor n=1 Tax=Kitasatospora fiedleri TaxID=2991545 RepID=UPI00249B0C44|nr:ribonuclease inhibitor [Kitasatospora fiedleri]
MAQQFAGVPSVAPRPVAELAPLLAWLRSGSGTDRRIDFPAGTALPDGRLDLCKQQLGPQGARLVADALAGSARSGEDGEAPVRHLLLGTDGLGDDGAVAFAARAAETPVRTLYLGCNGITAAGACRIADRLRASPQTVRALWLKRNPLGIRAGQAAAELIAAAERLRTLDLVQTGLDAAGLAVLADALLTGGRRFERLYVGGNPLGPAGAEPLARLIAAGAADELYASAAGLGDRGARTLAAALRTAPHGRLRRLSLASSGLGPDAAAELTAASAAAGVELLDLGRVPAAHVLGAADNRVDLAAADRIGAALAAAPHRLDHLVLTHTGVRSREAHRLLDHAVGAATPTRYLLGKGVAGSVRHRLNALSAAVPPPVQAPDVAAVHSVHRTAATPAER